MSGQEIVWQKRTRVKPNNPNQPVPRDHIPMYIKCMLWVVCIQRFVGSQLCAYPVRPHPRHASSGFHIRDCAATSSTDNKGQVPQLSNWSLEMGATYKGSVEGLITQRASWLSYSLQCCRLFSTLLVIQRLERSLAQASLPKADRITRLMALQRRRKEQNQRSVLFLPEQVSYIDAPTDYLGFSDVAFVGLRLGY